MSPPRLDVLLAWCNHNDILIDPRIHVIESGNHQKLGDHSSRSSSSDHGITVYSLEDQLDYSCVLARIPKTSILSTKSCSLSQDIPIAPYGHTAHLALALALYAEILRGQDSRWFGYIQSLPRETVDIAIFWGVEDVIDSSFSVCSSRGCTLSQSAVPCVASNVATCSTMEFPEHPSLQLLDGRQARMCLGCTEAEKELSGLMNEIRHYYVDVVEPTLLTAFGERSIEFASDGNPHVHQHSKRLSCESNCVEPSLPGFCHAYSLVSSRAFSVDSYHGLAMVPIADAFNHNNENHVHMESDFDVCVECGSLAECNHDGPLISDRVAYSLPEARVPPLALAEADTLDMLAVRPIPARSEVFNTYGSLSNAELISRYGFILPENEHDIVRLSYGSLVILINRLVHHVRARAAGGRAPSLNRNSSVPQDDCGGSHGSSEYRNSVGPHDGYAYGTDAADDFAGVFRRVYFDLARWWTTDVRWDDMGDDGMVYNMLPPVPFPRSLLKDPDCAVPEAFHINVEGKLTHPLWLFCALFATCMQSPETMSRLADVTCTREDDPARQRVMEDVKRNLLDVQDYVDSARQVTEGDRDISTLAPLGTICSDIRDVTFDLESKPRDNAGNLAYATVTSALTRECSGTLAALPQPQPTPGPHLSPSQATSSSGLRSRTLSVEEERAQKRARLSTLDALGSEENMPGDVFGRPTSRTTPSEDTVSTGDSATDAEHITAPHDYRAPVAKTLARVVVHLCQHRMRYGHVSDGQAVSSLNAAEIGELLDATPLHMRRTRVAMLLALSEKSVLESCAATWEAVLESVDNDDK